MINPPKTLIEESIVLSSSSLINKRLNNTHAILYRVGHRVTGWLAHQEEAAQECPATCTWWQNRTESASHNIILRPRRERLAWSGLVYTFEKLSSLLAHNCTMAYDTRCCVANRSYFLLLHNKCINDLLVGCWRTTQIVYVSTIMRRQCSGCLFVKAAADCNWMGAWNGVVGEE